MPKVKHRASKLAGRNCHDEAIEPRNLIHGRDDAFVLAEVTTERRIGSLPQCLLGV